MKSRIFLFSRSTPRRDSFYGGNDDLTAAIGWEEDGVTTVMFRKPVTGSRDSGKSDHDFSGLLKVIWAYGQQGVDFFKDDELKYHGGNRGWISLRKFLFIAITILVKVQCVVTTSPIFMPFLSFMFRYYLTLQTNCPILNAFEPALIST